MNFRTGYYTRFNEVEFDNRKVFCNYLNSWFLVDLVSALPFELMSKQAAADGDFGAFKLLRGSRALRALRLLRYAKLTRVLKMPRIIDQFNRQTFDWFADLLENKRSDAMFRLTKLFFGTCTCCHLMACIFVLIGRSIDLQGGYSWLSEEGYDFHDTESDRTAGPIYLASFYFCFTTLTSVGYGDITPVNNTERAYSIILQMAGGFVYALIVASLTAVVTSIDANQRQVVEKLDAVCSYVRIRKLPPELGRRVRKHFRHLYSQKAAVDEHEILKELSKTLRAEVSDFLVSELMKKVDLFSHLSPDSWVRILPMLRPNKFEANELICAQGDAAMELHIILEGSCLSRCMVEFEDARALSRDNQFLTTAERAIMHQAMLDREGADIDNTLIAGDTVGALGLMELWHTHIETVSCDTVVETYSIDVHDFGPSFKDSSETMHMFAQIASLDFKWAKDAASEFGRPVYRLNRVAKKSSLEEFRKQMDLKRRRQSEVMSRIQESQMLDNSLRRRSMPAVIEAKEIEMMDLTKMPKPPSRRRSYT